MRLAGKFGITALAALVIMTAGCQTTTQLESTRIAAPELTTAGVNQTLIVDSVDDSGPGSLRDAIDKANASPGLDRILFRSDSGLYRQPQTLRLTRSLPVITDALLIDGYIEDMLWKPSGVTLDGQGRHRILELAENVSARIAHLTLAGGSAERGGALLNRGTLVLSGVLLTDNGATLEGGAIFNAGTLFLINSTVHRNRAGNAGGGLYHEGPYLKVTHATFDRNQAPEGGGLFSRGQALVQNSILANSESEFDCLARRDFDAASRANIIETSRGCGEVFSSEDPGLGQLGGYNGPTRTLPVSSRSAAFNRADNGASVDENGQPLVWDQRGNGDPRFALGIADIGAFEVQPRVRFEVDTHSDEDIRGCTSARADCSLRGALMLLNHSDRHQRLAFDRELFRDGGTIRLRSPLPEILKDLTLDAGAVGPVVLTGESTLRPADGVRLETINVERR